MLSEQNGGQETAWLDVSVQPGPVVRISGEIDMQSSPQLREQLLVIIRRHGARLTLDLTGVTFIDCGGINALLAARRRALLEGGWLCAAGLTPSPAGHHAGAPRPGADAGGPTGHGRPVRPEVPQRRLQRRLAPSASSPRRARIRRWTRMLRRALGQWPT